MLKKLQTGPDPEIAFYHDGHPVTFRDVENAVEQALACSYSCFDETNPADEQEFYSMLHSCRLHVLDIFTKKDWCRKPIEKNSDAEDAIRKRVRERLTH